MLWCLNVYLAYPLDRWSHFIATNVSGAGALAWVAGISYMVVTTLSVLQLREVSDTNTAVALLMFIVDCCETSLTYESFL